MLFIIFVKRNILAMEELENLCNEVLQKTQEKGGRISAVYYQQLVNFEYNSLYNKIKNYDEKKFSFWLGV